MKTRDRIVEEARRLFNAAGYGNVTTSALAAHLGIAEGNLWYHFKTKKMILEAIAEDYARAIESRLTLLPAAEGDIVADYAELMHVVIDEFRAFRSLFRDQADYGEHVEPIATHARDWIERTNTQLEAYLAVMVDRGLLDWPRDRLADLAINATIIFRYGLEHYRELGERTEEGTGAVRKTLARHLTLFEHALVPEARHQLRLLIDQPRDQPAFFNAI